MANSLGFRVGQNRHTSLVFLLLTTSEDPFCHSLPTFAQEAEEKQLEVI